MIHAINFLVQRIRRIIKSDAIGGTPLLSSEAASIIYHLEKLTRTEQALEKAKEQRDGHVNELDNQLHIAMHNAELEEILNAKD